MGCHPVPVCKIRDRCGGLGEKHLTENQVLDERIISRSEPPTSALWRLHRHGGGPFGRASSGGWRQRDVALRRCRQRSVPPVSGPPTPRRPLIQAPPGRSV